MSSINLQYLAARAMDFLPARMKVALSGEPAIVVDGQPLDPQAQLLRSARRRRVPFGLIEPTVEAGRRRYRRQAEIFTGQATAVGAVRDFDIPGPAGPMRVRHYVPRGASRDLADPRASPLRTHDLSNLPPALVVIAGFDILSDEGEAYARALSDAGTSTRVVRCLDLEHGFIHMTGICAAARLAVRAIAHAWSGR